VAGILWQVAEHGVIVGDNLVSGRHLEVVFKVDLNHVVDRLTIEVRNAGHGLCRRQVASIVKSTRCYNVRHALTAVVERSTCGKFDR